MAIHNILRLLSSTVRYLSAMRFIQYGQITLAKIKELRSENYVQGQTGTIMKSDGTFEMNGAVAGEGATKMTNLNYSVKDGNGVLRVQIGKLTGAF